MHTIQSLAALVVEKKRVAFSFFDESANGERSAVSIREADDWDRIDSEAEGSTEADGYEFYVVGYLRSGEVPFDTELSFKNKYEAGHLVVCECIHLTGGGSELA
jgi:hypothetical protein